MNSSNKFLLGAGRVNNDFKLKSLTLRLPRMWLPALMVGSVVLLGSGFLMPSMAMADGGKGATALPNASHDGGMGGVDGPDDEAVGKESVNYQGGVAGGGGGAVNTSTGAGAHGGAAGGATHGRPGEVGAAGRVVSSSQTISTAIIGGAGDAGQSADTTVGAGGGGGGGVGLTATADVDIAGTGSVIGGRGGVGGGGASGNAGGGGGGSGVITSARITVASGGVIQGGAGGAISGDGGGGGGGMGVILLPGGNLINSGAIVGGNGGTPGAKTFTGGGDGGAGVLLTGGGQVVNAAGASITGGSGGGTIAHPTLGVFVGRGGVGVKGENISLVNAGSIVGGVAGSNHTVDGSTQAAAVQFTGGINSIELQAGSVINGNVLAFSEADTFKLGGDADSAFDVSSIGNTAQYRGFGTFEKTGDSTWTLTGTTGDVTAWTLSSGTLSVSEDANLGAVAGGLTFDGGTLQVTGTQYTSSARAMTLGEHGGGFDIVDANNAFTVSQVLSGQGAVWKRGDGTLILSGDNSFSGGLTVEKGMVKATTVTAFGSGVVNIASGASADMADLDMTIGGLKGAGAITMGHGNLTLDSGVDSAFAGGIDGTGGLTKTGAGTQTLSGINNYTGLTSVAGGTLSQGAAGAFNTTSSGYTVGTDGTLDLGGFSATVAALSNSGSVTFGGAGGTVLNVKGNYAGSGGLLVFNSVLGDDASNTDKLVVNGDTSGTTRVSVNNLGGSGASTLSGMELISVGGNSAGEFTQQGRIAAGAYDYSLMRGTGADANNWYLSSSLTPPVIPPVDPPVTPPVDPSPGVQVLRPEAGAYIGNLAAANSMFTTNLDDRLGETEYTDAVTGEHKVTSLWMRTGGGHNRSEDSSGQLKMKANRYSVMLGGDLAAGSSSNGSTWRLGGLAGYGNDRNTTTSDITGYRAKGEVDGYTTGLYGTWYANGTDEAGLYADTVLQYSWFNNTVKGDELANESYKSKGLSASLESGYVFDLGSHAGNSYFLQPKAQLAWSGIRADDYTEQNGTRVTSTGNDNVRSSLGVKAFMKGYTAQGDGKQQSFKPYVETNWVHNSEDYGVRMDGVDVSQEGSRNIAEFRVGVEGHVMPQLNVTTSLTQQVGSNGWSDTAGMLGLKYSF